MNRRRKFIAVRQLLACAAILCLSPFGTIEGAESNDIMSDNPSRADLAPRQNAPASKYDDTKDIWDRIQIIGGITVPITVAVLAWALSRIAKSSDDRSNRDILFRLVSLYTSGNPRDADIAEKLLGIDSGNKRHRGESKAISKLLEPKMMADILRRAIHDEGPAVRPFESTSHRLCYGWVTRFLVPVWLEREDIWTTGLLHGQHVILSCSNPTSGTLFVKGKRFAFSAKELLEVKHFPLLLYRLSDNFDEVEFDEAEEADYGMVGYAIEEKGLSYTVRPISTSIFSENYIQTNQTFDTSLAGFSVVRAGGRGMVGLASSQGESGRLVILRWRSVLNCIRASTASVEGV